MEAAGRRDFDVYERHDQRGRGWRYEQQEDEYRRRHDERHQHSPDEHRYFHHPPRRGSRRESPRSRRSRTPPSNDRPDGYQHYDDRRERHDVTGRRRRAGRSTSPYSRSSNHGLRRETTSRSQCHGRRESRSRSRSTQGRRHRHRDSFSHRGRRDDDDEHRPREHYYHSYSDRDYAERQGSKRRRPRRREESSSEADERSYSPSPSPRPPPRHPPLHPPPPPPPNEALPRAGVVSDDEEHHHQYASTTTKLPASTAAAAAAATAAARAGAVARLPRSPSRPSNKHDDADDNNKITNLRSPSFHDDSVGHFRGGRGTLIADRYRIIRDVGFGTFGRVVECLDLDSGRRRRSNSNSHDYHHRGREGQRRSSSSAEKNYVAIKIVRKVKRYNESAQIEARIVQDVNRRGGRGLTHCAILHDAFTFSGHFCMVFENLGLSLYDFLKRNKYQPFPMACIQDFTVQLLQTLEFLHSFRLIHTDLKIENILLVNDRETTHGSNSRVPESTHIKVIDFGGACYDDAKKSAVINTRQYRAPEVMLGTGWSMPSDIWSLGCILAELYQGELLFPTHNNVEHLALMEHVLGPFPFSIIQSAKSASDLAREAFDSHGRHVMERILSAESTSFVKKSSRLESIIRNPHDDWFLQLLRRMLVFDPEARATAHECLRYLSTIRRDVVRHV